METQGIIIWTQRGSGALIVWCADNGGLVYVADRRRVGDTHEALSIGDFVDLRIVSVGAIRMGRDLRFRARGGAWLTGELERHATAGRGPVISPRAATAQSVRFGSEVMSEVLRTPPANRPARNETGTD